MANRSRPIWLVDTTLRDGEQRADVAFSNQQRATIAIMLDGMGVPEIEVGTPAAGGDEMESIRQIGSLRLGSRLTGWCRALTADLDAAQQAGLASVHFSLPASEVLLGTLGRRLPWVFQQLRTLVAQARQQFEFVSVGLQDASRTKLSVLQQLAQSAADLGAHRVRIADTVGVWDPLRTFEVLRSIREATPKIMLGFHGHNDLGMATANSLAAIQAGADSVDVTVGGLGERAGNAALEEVVMAMRVALRLPPSIESERLSLLCEYVANASGMPLSPSKPIVGKGIFRHESGIHVRAMQSDRRAYEPFDPSEVGQNASVMVIGKHSGRAALHHAFAQAGIELSGDQIERLLPVIRQSAGALGRSLSSGEVVQLFENQQAASL